MDNAILTPSAIWKDFTADGELKPSVVREYAEDGVLFREVYFNGKRLEDGVTRIYAVFACPEKLGCFPAILFCGDFGSAIDIGAQAEMARNGYASLCFDYAGEREGAVRYTIYPKSIDYANYERAGRHLDHVDTVATETSLYAWTRVARYCARYLTAQSEVDATRIAVIGMRRGGYLAWQLASFCPEIRAACAFFEGGWTEYENKFKYGAEGDMEKLDAERERWLAGLATQVYAPHVKVPFLYLGATNDRLGNMDRVADTLVRLDEKSSYAAFAPRLDGLVTQDCLKTAELFLKKHLNIAQTELAQKPSLIFLEREGALFVRFQPDLAEEAESVALYYALGEKDARVRNWCGVSEIFREGSSYLGEIKEYDSDELVFGYGAVTYRNGLYLTTNIAMLRPADVNSRRQHAKHEQMLYNSSMGTDSFTVLKLPEERETGVSVPDPPVELREGAFGIKGIAPIRHCLATYKLGDIRYRGSTDNLLKFDLCAPRPAPFTIVCCEDYCRPTEKRYRYTVDLLGGDLWQKIELAPSAFKTAESLPLKSWENVSLLYFVCDEEYLLNNMLWL